MRKFTLQSATLGDIDGQGYAFTKRTFEGREVQGILFVDDEQDVEALQQEDELIYEGALYYRRKTQGPREEHESFPVEITGVLSTGMGHRVSFSAVETV
ncbi:MAG: hypothetical protein AAGI71_01485 [Bacteroidota bacterium]